MLTAISQYQMWNSSLPITARTTISVSVSASPTLGTGCVLSLLSSSQQSFRHTEDAQKYLGN